LREARDRLVWLADVPTSTRLVHDLVSAMQQGLAEIIGGRERRRRWGREEKLRIVGPPPARLVAVRITEAASGAAAGIGTIG
jgi:hypothetical protein